MEIYAIIIPMKTFYNVYKENQIADSKTSSHGQSYILRKGKWISAIVTDTGEGSPSWVVIHHKMRLDRRKFKRGIPIGTKSLYGEKVYSALFCKFCKKPIHLFK